MRIGKIIDVEKLSGSKKLLKLRIDLGSAIKQSVAAVGDNYSPEQLKSKLVVVVTNLKPRKVFGTQSEVMILATLDGSSISLLTPDKQVNLGSKIS